MLKWTFVDERGQAVSYKGKVTSKTSKTVTMLVSFGEITVPLHDGTFTEISPVDVGLTNTGMRKSDAVRKRIALAKQQQEDRKVVISWACQELGMSRSLAATYVKNNWGSDEI